MNRAERRLAARVDSRPAMKPIVLASTEIPTPESIRRYATKAFLVLDDLQFRQIADHDMSGILELFVMGRDISVQLAKQGMDDANDFILLFDLAGESMANIASRDVRRATGKELWVLQDAAKVLDSLLTEAPPAMVLRAQAAAANMVTRVYNHRKPICKKNSKRSRRKN